MPQSQDKMTSSMTSKEQCGKVLTRKRVMFGATITSVVLLIVLSGTKDLSIHNHIVSRLTSHTKHLFNVFPMDVTKPSIAGANSNIDDKSITRAQLSQSSANGGQQTGKETKTSNVPFIKAGLSGYKLLSGNITVNAELRDVLKSLIKEELVNTFGERAGILVTNNSHKGNKTSTGETNRTDTVSQTHENVSKNTRSEPNRINTTKEAHQKGNTTLLMGEANRTGTVKGTTNNSAKEGFNYFGSIELNTDVNEQSFEPYCAMESNWHKHLLWPETPSDLTDWRHARRRKCPRFTIRDNLTNTPRLKYSLSCAGKPVLSPSVTHSSGDIDVVTLDNSCLTAFTNSCCSNGHGIPNIIHYVWYFKKPMRFETFLSMLSVVRFVRPCLILFHGEYVPYGKYWDHIVRLYPNIIHVNTKRPLSVFGQKITHHEHSGDVMRIHALMKLGGIYIDTDVIVLRDLKPLREYDITMCRQSGGQFLLNSFIMSKKNATFLTPWLEGYKQYKNDSYVHNSMFVNNDLARAHPELIHIENGTMCCPDVLVGVNLMSPMIYDWSKLYGFHIYSRQINFPWDIDLIRNFNSTFGAMLRHVVYGNKELCL